MTPLDRLVLLIGINGAPGAGKSTQVELGANRADHRITGD